MTTGNVQVRGSTFSRFRTSTSNAQRSITTTRARKKSLHLRGTRNCFRYSNETLDLNWLTSQDPTFEPSVPKASSYSFDY